MSKKQHRSVPQPAPWDPESGERPQLGAVDEAVVDAPSRQTLMMLGVICAGTLIMWAAGRAACNYHVPGEGLTPRAVTLEEKARGPKDAAIELAQALSGADFETAQKLILPSAQALIEQAKKCGDCALEKAARASLLSVPEVISASRTEAYVAVKTIGGPAGEVERVFHLERDVKNPLPWRVTKLLPGRDALAPLEGALPPEAVAPSRPTRPGPQRVPLPPEHPQLAPGDHSAEDGAAPPKPSGSPASTPE